MTSAIDRTTFATHYITLRYPGFEPQRFLLEKSLNGIAILNLSSGCFWLTDALTGAMIEYSPNAYHFELRPAGPPPAIQPPSATRDHDALWFVLFNHHRLRTEVSRHGGEYLRTLASLWRVDYDALRSRIAQRDASLLSLLYAYDFYVELRGAAG